MERMINRMASFLSAVILTGLLQGTVSAAWLQQAGNRGAVTSCLESDSGASSYHSVRNSYLIKLHLLCILVQEAKQEVCCAPFIHCGQLATVAVFYPSSSLEDEPRHAEILSCVLSDFFTEKESL